MKTKLRKLKADGWKLGKYKDVSVRKYYALVHNDGRRVEGPTKKEAVKRAADKYGEMK